MPKAKKRKWKGSKVKNTSNAYSRIYHKTTVDPDLVLYRSVNTARVSWDLFALFTELLQDEKQSRLKHVWAVDDLKKTSSEPFVKYKGEPQVSFVKTGSKKYLELMASAGTILYEKYLPRFFVKKPEQICVNIWTDTPFVRLGMEEKTKQFSNVWNIQKPFFSCDYLITPNEFTTETLMRAFNLKGLFAGAVLEAGYPFHKFVEPVIKEDKVILYAPSARKENGRYIDSAKVIKSHVDKLKKDLPAGYKILVHLDSVDYDSVVKKKLDVPLAPKEMTEARLVSMADMLVTDCSPLMLHFTAFGKPVVFFDFDRLWEKDRDRFYFTKDELCGPVCETVKQTGEAIAQALAGKKFPFLGQFMRKYLTVNEEVGLKAIIQSVFEKRSGIARRENTDKKRLLLHIGLLGRIAERELCFYILRNIDYDKFTVVVDGNDIYSYQKEFQRIHSGIQIVNSKFENNKSFSDKKHLKDFDDKELEYDLFQWEFNSMYGGLSFDVIIDTVGKETVWMNVFSRIQCGYKALVLNQNNNTEPVLKKYADFMDKILVVEGTEAVRDIHNKVECITKDEFIGKCGINSLNVLFISAFDSTNYVFVNLIKDLTKRGHSCTVVVKDKDDNINNKMYIQENIEFIEIDEFDLKLVDVVDFVFSAPLKYDCYNSLYKRINTANKFVLTFASLFSSIVMSVNPDLSLSLGESKFAEFRENGLKYNLVAIGNPQYDRLIRLRNELPDKNGKPIQNVLMMEQGAYPFGKKGKQELADVLCHVCRANPQITVTVKPRYLPSEKGKQLHVLSEHLYDFITDKPHNLILLKEPVVLEDIMHQFDAAMTTWSTAYLDAAILGLPLILIEGLDSIDVYNVRNQRIDAAYDRLRHSGCVVNYMDLYKPGPLPFRMVEEGYLAEEIYSPHEPCVPRIMDLLEFLYRKLIITEKRWKNINQLTFDEFFDRFEELPLIDVKSNEFRQRKRLMNETNRILQKFIFENRCMAQVIDVSPVYQAWDYEVGEDTPGEEITGAIKALRQKTEDMKRDFFLNHFDLVCKDRILQDYYFQWLFTQKQYKELLDYDRELICPESLYFYRAVILYKKHKYKAGTKYMTQFLQISDNKECKDLRKDMSLSGYLWKGRIGKYMILYYLDRYGAYDVIESVDSQGVIYQRDVMLYYKVKSYMGRGLYQEAVELCKEYSKSLLKKTKSRNLKTRMKYYVGRFFYKKTERLSMEAKKQLASKEAGKAADQEQGPGDGTER